MAELTDGGVVELTFLHSCSLEDVAALRSHASARRYEAGTAIFHEREAPGRVYVVDSGFVKMSRLSDEGREVILAIRGPGDLLGEQSALDGLPRSATAIALDDVSALVLARGDFLEFLGGHPLTGLVLLTMLSQRLREADLKRVGLSVQDTVARLAERIVELAERFGEDVDGTVEISLPMSQDDLASWSGCSRDSVVKALQTMRSLGWVETGRRRITVLQLDELRRRTAS